MRVHIRWVRFISVVVLVLLLGGTYPARPVSPVRAAGLWYVSKAGANTNNCLSPATACGTFDGVMAKITPGDTVLVDSGMYQPTRQYPTVVVELNKSVILSGGWNATFTAQTGFTTIDGQGVETGIYIPADAQTVAIDHFVVENNGTGISNDSADLTLDACIIQNNGDETVGTGGIYSRNSVMTTILNTTIRNNSGVYAGGIFANLQIESGLKDGVARLILKNSSLLANSGGDVGGMEIASYAGLTGFIENSTISGNYGDYAGGLSGSFEIFNSTIYGNSSTSGYGGISSIATTLHNSILAGNGVDCQYVYSGGYNLFSEFNGCAVDLQPGDQRVADPGLGPLEGNPAYHYLLPSSPAIDAGNPTGCLDHTGALLDADQRGLPRVGRCDIGAVEYQPAEVSTFNGNPDPVHPGQVITFSGVLNTGGVETLAGVTLDNSLPAGIAYLPGSLQASAGTAQYQNGKVTWSGDLDPATPVTLTYQAKAIKIGLWENPFLLTQAGLTIARTVVVNITPWPIYLPVLHKPCPNYYADNFTNPASGWFTGNTSRYLVQYLPGEYQMLLKVPGYYLISRAPVGPLSNEFQVSVDVRNMTGVEGSYGLMFAATADWSHFYTLEIMPDQTWYLWRQYSNNWDLPAYGYSDAIRTGSQPNTLTVRHQDNLFTLYINNIAIYSHFDSSYYYYGFVGVTAQSFDAVPLDMRFSNFFMPEFSCIAQASGLTRASSPAGGAPGGILQGPANRPLP